MMISEIIAVICILFSYGLFLNTQERVGELSESERTFVYDFYAYDENGNYVYDNDGLLDDSSFQENIGAKITELTGFLSDDFDNLELQMSVIGEDENRYSAKVYHDISGDSLFKDVDFSETPYVCKVSSDIPDTLYKDGNITIDGIKYKMLGTGGNTADLFMPLSSVSDKAKGVYLIFSLKEQPTKERKDEVTSKCFELFGAGPSASPEPRQLLVVQINNMFYLYSAIITVIVIINLSLYFKYVFQTRKKEMYIFKLCGGTASQIAEIFVLETVMELVVGFAAGLTLFKGVGIGICEKFYPHFPEYYSYSIYSKVFAIYIVISLAIIYAITVPYVNKVLNIDKRGEA
ncbi:MAG: FtsX-like permease family protein [Oscillospiraceae bacterium]